MVHVQFAGCIKKYIGYFVVHLLIYIIIYIIIYNSQHAQGTIITRTLKEVITISNAICKQNNLKQNLSLNDILNIATIGYLVVYVVILIRPYNPKLCNPQSGSGLRITFDEANLNLSANSHKTQSKKQSFQTQLCMGSGESITFQDFGLNNLTSHV